MPFVAPLVTAVMGTSVLASVVTFTINATISVGLSQLLSPKQKGQERQAQVTSLQIGENARGVIFGEVATGGTLVKATNYGGGYGTDYEVLVIALADHRCEALLGFYVDDEYVAFTGNGPVSGFTNAGGQSCLDVYFFDGSTATQTVPSTWNLGWPNPVLDGVCFVAVRYKYNPKVWSGGRPKLLWRVKGKRCYDPRLDTTVGGSGAHRWNDPSTWAWTDNAAVCRYNFQRGIYALDQVGDPSMLLVGRGLSEEEADPARVFASANVCDELVATGASTTEKRYRVGCYIAADEAWEQVEENFAAAMAGVIVQPDGGIDVEPGQSKAVAATITDDDLLNGREVAFSPFISDARRVNTVIPRYVEPAQMWKDHAAPLRRNATDITDDGGIRDETLSLPFVTSVYQAQRCGEIHRRLMRLERTATVTLGPKWSFLEDGDWIDWTSGEFHDGATITYRVESYTLAPNHEITLELREIASSVYSWTAADVIQPQAEEMPTGGGGGTIGPSPAGDLALSSVTASGVTITDGFIKRAGGKISWATPLDEAIDAVAVEWRRQGATKSEGTFTVHDEDAGEQEFATKLDNKAYEVRARPIPKDPGRTWAWSSWLSFTSGLHKTPTTSLVSASTGATLGDSDVITSQGTAAAIVNQGGLATRNHTEASSAPGSPGTGDLWTDTSATPVKLKRWNGSAWVVQATYNTGALADLNTADTAQLAAFAATRWSTQVQTSGLGGAGTIFIAYQGSPASNYTQLDEFTFTVDTASVPVLIEWNGQINWNRNAATNTILMVTIDGNPAFVAGADTNTELRKQYQGNQNALNLDVILTVLKTTLSAGSHTVKIWGKTVENPGVTLVPHLSMGAITKVIQGKR